MNRNSNPDLSEKKVALLVADGFEQIELTSPRDALESAGVKAVIVSPCAHGVQGWNHFEKGDTFDVDVPLESARAGDFDALILPGGVANPDQLRTNPRVIQFVRDFFKQNKPVAAICHGPWTLIDAGVADGREMTSYHSIKTDLKNAGAEWVDREVVVDGALITSRSPEDLDAFNAALCEALGVAETASQK